MNQTIIRHAFGAESLELIHPHISVMNTRIWRIASND